MHEFLLRSPCAIAVRFLHEESFRLVFLRHRRQRNKAVVTALYDNVIEETGANALHGVSSHHEH